MIKTLKYLAKRLIGRERLLALRRAPYVGRLHGSGIEIGALHTPIVAPHLEVKYVDRMTKRELLSAYPELPADKIVDVDIVCDAEGLDEIEDCSQDFVIANHVIEHMRNPIGALFNWQRVLKKGGCLYLAAPDKDKTFDTTRPLTDNDHLLLDYLKPSAERDSQAFLEFAREVSCRHFAQAPVAEAAQVAKELEDQDYSIHFHVWNFESFARFLKFVSQELDGWRMTVVDSMRTKGEEFIWVLKK